MVKKVTCICCPLGCRIIIEKDGKYFRVSGNECKKGNEYAIKEVTDPQRIITSTIRIKNGIREMLPVKSEKMIQKKLIRECVKELSKVELSTPIKRGEIVFKNILNTGVNIIATRDMEVL